VSAIDVMPELTGYPPSRADGALPAVDLVPPPNNLGREKLVEWTQPVWERIDNEVVCEIDRACVATRFLPRLPSLSPSERTVAADLIEETDQGVLFTDQSKVTPLLEESELFLLRKEQYHEETRIGTGATLASRAANRLAKAMDEAIFQGTSNPSLVAAAEANQVVEVDPIDAGAPGVYGENSFKAVAQAYAFLQGKNYYGPYALIVFADQFADTHAPLASTLIMPADRIRPLMTAGFYGTGTVPPNRGVMVSIGGNTVDVAIGVHGATAFTQIDDEENYRFRVYERFTVRIKDPGALVLLAFQ
jgi:uncharacterized linocin/CFP29 family protein